MSLRIDDRILHDFELNIAPSLRLLPTARAILARFVAIDVTAEEVAALVGRNQYVEHFLVDEIRRMARQEELPRLHTAIALMGMARTRDLVCALQIVRGIGRRHWEPGIKPAEHVAYARRSEDLVLARRLEYSDTAYAAGLLFDLMLAVARERYNDPKKFPPYVAEVYKHGLRSALIGHELASLVKLKSFSKFVFAGCLVHDIGKLAMALLHSESQTVLSYDGFCRELVRDPLSREVRHFHEARRFGMTHDYYGSLICRSFGFFESIEKSILFHHEPYLLRSTSRDHWMFSCLIALASNMATHFRAPKDAGDALIGAWLTPELNGFKVDPMALKRVVEKVSALTGGR